MKLISGLAHKHLIEATGKSIAKHSAVTYSGATTGYHDILWGETEETEEKIIRGRPRYSSSSVTHLVRAISSDSINAESGSDSEKAAPLAVGLRSRSTSTGARRPKKLLPARKFITNEILSDCKQVDGEINPDKERRLSILKGLSPHLGSALRNRAGAIQGLWLVTSPLQIHPAAYWTALTSINENSRLSENKSLEWKLDLLKEFDEKRISRLESFAVSKRNDNFLDTTLKFSGRKPFTFIRESAAVGSSTSGVVVSIPAKVVKKPDYYKDKGRQPYKSTDAPYLSSK